MSRTIQKSFLSTLIPWGGGPLDKILLYLMKCLDLHRSHFASPHPSLGAGWVKEVNLTQKFCYELNEISRSTHETYLKSPLELLLGGGQFPPNLLGNE